MKAPAFITGGSSGIGLELAKLLAQRGHDIAIFARDAGRLQGAVQVLKAQFPDVRIAAWPLDVADRAACEQVLSRAIGDLGPPGWAIANAGIAEPGEFLTQDIAAFETQMQINYMGALYFAKALAGPMAEAGGGRLVFVGSGAGFVGLYGYGAYAPPKFAMRGLAEVLRVELAPRNISVTLAYPPDTETPMLTHEERFKPEPTKAITAGGGGWASADVARRIVGGADKSRSARCPRFWFFPA